MKKGEQTPLQKAKAKIKELKAENMAFHTRISTLERHVESASDCISDSLKRQIKGHERNYADLQEKYINVTAKLAKLIR